MSQELKPCPPKLLSGVWTANLARLYNCLQQDVAHIKHICNLARQIYIIFLKKKKKKNIIYQLAACFSLKGPLMMQKKLNKAVMGIHLLLLMKLQFM